MADGLVVVSTNSQAVQQLVFRAEFSELRATSAPAGCNYRHCSSLWKFVRYAERFWRSQGMVEVLRSCLRIARGGRSFYCVLDGEEMIHFGWVTEGYCRQYEIDRSAYVIGPIWSSPAARGRGVATYATSETINWIVGRGGRVVYIDTSEDNLACRRVIEKCGFGAPVNSYARPKHK
jgi:GNAT superfamily N-acetyltransferase